MTDPPSGDLSGAAEEQDDADDLIAADDDQVERSAFVPSDNTTLTSVVDGFMAEGFAGHFTPEPGGVLRCSGCGAESAAADFTVAAVRRLEGASDPDEMVAVVAARCPRCDVAGLAVLGFGPAASEEDQDVAAQLDTSSTTPDA